MFQPLPTPKRMAAWDHRTIKDFGLPGMTLMETASREALAVLENMVGDCRGLTVLVMAGAGNNGGDAFALARHVHGRGAKVRIIHTRPKNKYQGESRANLILAQKLGIPMRLVRQSDTHHDPYPDVIIDGILGTGLSGNVREDCLSMIRAANTMRSRCTVLSLDIPSGLSGLTGKPSPEAVKAHATVTFGAAKIGLVMPCAADFTGELHVRDIGIPEFVIRDNPPDHYLITERILKMIPPPDPHMHKGRAGHVLIVGGSPGLTGAPQLAALAALRAGAGLATVACPGGLADVVKAGTPDVMVLPLGNGKTWTPDLALELVSHTGSYSALGIGPGLGREPETLEFLRTLTKSSSLPMVLDADALYHAAQDPDIIPAKAVLTPHAGEMSRLVGVTTKLIEQNRVASATEFASTRKVVLALKGPGTIVADPSGTARISPFATANLAVAGSGDVLTGVITSLLARGLDPLISACTGVYWHGLAGRHLANVYPYRGNLASQIAHTLPVVIQEESC